MSVYLHAMYQCVCSLKEGALEHIWVEFLVRPICIDGVECVSGKRVGVRGRGRVKSSSDR